MEKVTGPVCVFTVCLTTNPLPLRKEGYMSSFTSRLSPKYKETVRVLRELLIEEGLPMVDSAIAEVLQPARLESFRSSTSLVPAQGRLCAKRLIGKKCTRTGPHGCECNPKGADDHISLWKRDGAPSVFVAQPYALKLAELDGIVSYCRKYELDCSVDASKSWHFPGQTLRVEMTAVKPRDSHKDTHGNAEA